MFQRLSIDSLSPSINNYGSKIGNTNTKLNLASLENTIDNDKKPNNDFSSDILINKRQKRREEKLKCYNKMLNYCQNKIIQMDDNMKTDLFFEVVETIPDCKEYDPLECLKFISIKLRQENFDTIIISSTKMFITWKYIELKLEPVLEQEKS
jgi:hypothetical protein